MEYNIDGMAPQQPNIFKRAWQSVTLPHYGRTIGFLTLLVIALSVPATILFLQQRTNTQQKAATNAEVTFVDTNGTQLPTTVSNPNVYLKIIKPADWDYPSQGTLPKSSPIAMFSSNIVKPAYADCSINISGYVKNSAGTKEPGITVCLDPSGNGCPGSGPSTTTNFQGHYQFLNVAMGGSGHNVYLEPSSLPNGYTLSSQNPQLISDNVCTDMEVDFELGGSPALPTSTPVPAQPTATPTPQGIQPPQLTNPTNNASITTNRTTLWWNRIPGDDGSNTTYHVRVVDNANTSARHADFPSPVVRDCTNYFVCHNVNNQNWLEINLPDTPPAQYTWWVDVERGAQKGLHTGSFNFTYATTTVPTATPTPQPTAIPGSGSRILSKIVVANSDDGSGGGTELSLTGADMINHITTPFPWKLNPNGSTAKTVLVTFYDQNGHSVPVRRTINLVIPGAPTATPTPVPGTLNANPAAACVTGDPTREKISVSWTAVAGAQSYMADLKAPGGSIGGINCVNASTNSFNFPNDYTTGATYTVGVTAFSTTNCDGGILKTEVKQLTNAACVTGVPGQPTPISQGCILSANPSSGNPITFSLSPLAIIQTRPSDAQIKVDFGDNTNAGFDDVKTGQVTHTYQNANAYTAKFTATSQQQGANYNFVCSTTVQTNASGESTGTPTSSITPPPPGPASVSFKLVLAGIGPNTGTHGPQTIWNSHPFHQTKQVTIYLYKLDTDTTGDSDGAKTAVPPIPQPQGLTWDGNTYFTAINLNLGNTVTPGQYQMFIRVPTYLRKRIPGIVTIDSKNNIIIPVVTLIPGDANNDNHIDALDYTTVYLECLKQNQQTPDCVAKTDFNDDGYEDSKTSSNFSDYRLFIQYFGIKEGD